MVSRAEKYHDKALNDNKRVLKNKDLYDTIYQEELYSNIEGVVETNVTNEIDISKVKELISKQQTRKENRLVKKELEMPQMELNLDDEGNYDICDVLAQAKEESDSDNKPRKLKDFDFEGIKNRINNVEKYTEEEQKKDIETLKELIETISNNTALNNLADRELSLDMFPDLKKTTELPESDNQSIKKIIAEAKLREIKEDNDELEIDKSFYTKTLDLKDKDFTEDGEDVKTSLPLFAKLLLIILAIVLLIVIVVVGYKVIKGIII